MEKTAQMLLWTAKAKEHWNVFRMYA